MIKICSGYRGELTVRHPHDSASNLLFGHHERVQRHQQWQVH